MRNKWLKLRLKEIGKTQKALADFIGLPEPRITDIIRGDRRVTAGESEKIAAFIGWSSKKVARMLDPSLPPLDTELDLIDTTRVPVVGVIEAGEWREAVEFAMDEDQPFVDVPPDPRYPGIRRFALRVNGPSMNQLYPDGSHVIVVPAMDLGDGWRPNNGQRVVVQRTNDTGGVETTVKEFMVREDGQTFLVPRSTDPTFVAWPVPAFWDGDGEFEEHSDNIRVTALVTQRLTNEP
nr:S24 family peptidase [uncultured Dongia sp.]